MVTIGYGTIALANNKERLLAVFALVCGSILAAGVTSIVGNIISDRNKTICDIRRYMQSTLLFCRSNEIPPSTQNHVSSYYNYLRSELKGHRDEEDFDLLSPSLQRRLITLLVQESIASISFLYPNDLATGFIFSASHFMVPYLATPKEVFATNCRVLFDSNTCTYQWLGGDFYFLRRGRVHTLTDLPGAENDNRQEKEKQLVPPGTCVIPNVQSLSPSLAGGFTSKVTVFIGLSKAVINTPFSKEIVSTSNKAMCHIEMRCGTIRRVSKVSSTKSVLEAYSSLVYEWDEFYFFPLHEKRRYIDINLFNSDTNIFSSGRVYLSEYLPVQENNDMSLLCSTGLFDIEEEEYSDRQKSTASDAPHAGKKKKDSSTNVIVPLWRDNKVIGSVDIVINFLVDNDDDDDDDDEKSESGDSSSDGDNEGKEDDGDQYSYGHSNDSSNDNIAVASGSNINEDDDDVVRYDAISDSYSHLFHLPYKRLLELRHLYSIQGSSSSRY